MNSRKAANKSWKDIPSKSDSVYVPVLNAFIDEVLRSYRLDNSVPSKMVEYLLGEFDFYKVISIDRKRITQVQTFNLRGALNKASRAKAPEVKVPRVLLHHE